LKQMLYAYISHFFLTNKKTESNINKFVNSQVFFHIFDIKVSLYN